ncbi:unnamed protein product [Lota lota]
MAGARGHRVTLRGHERQPDDTYGEPESGEGTLCRQWLNLQAIQWVIPAIHSGGWLETVRGAALVLGCSESPVPVASFPRILHDAQGDLRKIEFHRNKPVF